MKPPRSWYSVIHGVRAHVGSIAPESIRQLIGPKKNPVLFEIGANDGTDTLRFLEAMPHLTVHAFEPDPRPIARFQAHTRFPDRCHLHQVAVGKIDGEATLHQSGGTTRGAHLEDWDLSGSLHRPTGHLKMSPWCTFDREIAVKCTRLDTFVGSIPQLSVIDFMWVDVQGAEHDLIEGGRETMAKTRYLFSEFYDTPMYEGQRSLKQLLAMLGRDWELQGIYGLRGYRVHNGCDFLAKNKKVR